MKKSIYILSVFAFLLSACTNGVDESVSQGGKECSLIASFEQDGSRTTLDGTNVLWESGDEICVFTLYDNAKKFTTTDAGATAVFKGNTDAAPRYAVYPYSSSTQEIMYDGLNNNTYVNLPETQVYKENSFDSKVNIAVGKVEGNKIQFKNVLGMLKLQLKAKADENITVGRIKLIKKDSDPHRSLSGKLTVRLDLLPSNMQTAMSTGNDYVWLDCTSANGGTGVPLSSTETKSFLFALPKLTLQEGFKAEIYDMQNKLVNTIETNSNVEIIRSQIKVMATKEIERNEIEYIPLEYITATGQQYIKTGFHLTDDGSTTATSSPKYLCIETVAMFTESSSSTSSGSVYGYDTGASAQLFNPFYNEKGTDNKYDYLATQVMCLSYQKVLTNTDIQQHEIFNNKLRHYLRFLEDPTHHQSAVRMLDPESSLPTGDHSVPRWWESGNLTMYVNASSGLHTRWLGNEIYLGGLHNGSGENATNCLKGRIYSMKIWPYGTENYPSKAYRDFVPVLKRETGKAEEAGMYDKIHNKFYGSASGTPFIAGPTISVSNKYNTESFKK